MILKILKNFILTKKNDVSMDYENIIKSLTLEKGIELTMLKKFLLENNLFTYKWRYLLTLTTLKNYFYKFDHISLLFKSFKIDDLTYFGIIEKGEKLNVHYHILISTLENLNKMEIQEKWSNLLNEKSIEIDLTEIYSNNIINYILKNMNSIELDKIKTSLNIKYIYIFYTNIYFQFYKETELIQLEKELEDKVSSETFDKYRNNKKYSWYFLIGDLLVKNILNVIKIEKNKDEFYTRINSYDNNKIHQLLTFYVYDIIGYGIDTKIKKFKFLENLGQKLRNNFPFLLKIFNLRKTKIKLNSDEFIIKQDLILATHCFNFMQKYLDIYIKYNEEQSSDKEEHLIDYYYFTYTENFYKLISKNQLSSYLKNLEIGFLGRHNFMVVLPKNWTSIFNGGYLYNKIEFIKNTPHKHEFVPNQNYLKILNYLQSINLTLNFDLINFIYFNKQYFYGLYGSKKILQANIKKIILNIDQLKRSLFEEHSIIEGYNKNLSKKEKKAKYRKFFASPEGLKFKEKMLIYQADLLMLRENVSRIELFELIYLNSYYLIDYLYVEKIYIPYNVDFRGRIYPLTTHFNFHSSKYSRYLFKFSEKHKFNFEVFKIYSVRVYIKEKLNDLECLVKFKDEIEDLLKNFKPKLEIILKNCSNLFAFLSCCFEYENIQNYQKVFKVNNLSGYMSNFIVSLDASASGSQILSCLLRDKTFVKALNINENENGSIGDFYNEFILNIEKEISSEDPIKKKYWEESVLSKCDKIEKRKIFKNIIMTLNYGLTYIGFKKKFTEVYILYCKKKNFEIKINILTELIEIIWSIFKKIRLLIVNTIIISIMPILNVLDLELKWNMPGYGKINQKYIEKRKIKIDLRLNKSKKKKIENKPYISTLNLNVSINKLNGGLKRDGVKSGQAFTANYIHSMDASVLCMVVKEFVKKKKPIITVHDCFFVSTDDVEMVLKKYLNALEKLFLKNNLLEELLLNYKEKIEKYYANAPSGPGVNANIELLETEIKNIKMEDVNSYIKKLKKSKYAVILGG